MYCIKCNLNKIQNSQHFYINIIVCYDHYLYEPINTNINIVVVQEKKKTEEIRNTLTTIIIFYEIFLYDMYKLRLMADHYT